MVSGLSLETRNKRMAYKLMMLYVIKQAQLWKELRIKRDQIFQSPQVQAHHPLDKQALTDFLSSLLRNVTASVLEPEAMFIITAPHEDLAYTVMLYLTAQSDKKLIDLRRDIPRIIRELEELGISVSKDELLEFTSSIYSDVVRFACHG